MDKKFYSHWINGISDAIDELDDKSLDVIFGNCARACSESFTKEWYMDEYSKAKDLDEFVKNMDSKFDSMNMRMSAPNTIIVEYTACLCPLYEDKFIDSPKLCQCSLKSLIINWEAILGESKVDVTLVKSILAGDDICQFKVEIL